MFGLAEFYYRDLKCTVKIADIINLKTTIEINNTIIYKNKTLNTDFNRLLVHDLVYNGESLQFIIYYRYISILRIDPIVLVNGKVLFGDEKIYFKKMNQLKNRIVQIKKDIGSFAPFLWLKYGMLQGILFGLFTILFDVTDSKPIDEIIFNVLFKSFVFSLLMGVFNWKQAKKMVELEKMMDLSTATTLKTQTNTQSASLNP